MNKAARRAAKRNAKKFRRGLSPELWVDDYMAPTRQPVVGDHVSPWSGRLQKGGSVDTLGVKPTKKGTKAAKKMAARDGIDWQSLTKRQRGDLRLLARAEKGSTKAAAKLLKRLGVAPPAVPAAPVGDTAMLKTVLPGADVQAAQGAHDEIRKAMMQPVAGCSGWRA